jgi:archaellum component FlaC
MGGSSSPPTPPDYTPQRSAFAAEQSSARNNQAQQYNTQVQDFNNKLSGFSGQIGDLSGRVNSLGLQDYGQLNDYSNQVSGLSSQLRGMNFDAVKPNFDSVVQSPYGAVSVNVPGLASANYQGRDSALFDLNTLQTKIGDIRNQFRGEESNINQFKSDIFGQLSGVNSQLGYADIGNLNFLNQQRGQLDQLRSQLGAFSSPIAEYTDVDDNWLNKINPLFEQADARMADIFGRRDQAQQQITGFKDQIFGQLGDLGGQLDGMGIGDLGALENAQRQLRDIQRQKMGFSSQLPFDMNRENTMAQGLNSQLQDLMRQRQTEQQRVDEAQRQALQNSQFLGTQARMANPFDRGTIDSLMADIENIRGEKGQFSSELGFDFGRSNMALNTAESQLQALLGQRQQSLDRFGGQLDQLRASSENIQPHDEFMLRDQMNRVQQLQSQLGRFTGSDTSDLNFQVQDKVNAIDTRLRDLMSMRQNLQQQAQQMLSRVQEEAYLGTDQVMGDKDQARSLREQAQLYNAQQALAQINQVMQHLQGQKARLGTDAQNVLNAQQMAQREVQGMIGASGVPQFSNTPTTEYMTPEQYLALLQQGTQTQDNLYEPVQTSTFSSNLGL